ncbi:hypothetical protein BJ742DRAFT_258466 [Cladochytrium replicatum]|nr:hypothetical protein BJ742DRAFT_258466 [Cladochytrium replicatum]
MSALKQWFGRAGGASSSSTSSLKARKTTVSNPTIETVVQLVSEADPSFVITTYPYDKVAHLTLSQVRALIVHGPHVPSSENHLAPPQLLRSISASTDTASIASSRIGDVHGSDRMSRKSVEPVSLDRNESRSLNVTRDGRLGMRWRRRSSNAGLSSVSTAASSTVDGGAAGGYVLDAECFATGDSEVYLSYLFVDPKSGRVIPLLKEEKIFVRNLADQGGATAKIGVHLPQCVWNVIIEREVDSADEEEASFAFPLDGTDLVADIVKYFQVCWKGEAHEIISEKYDFTFGEYVRVDPKTTLQEFATFEAETFPTLTLHATGPTGTWILRASIDGNTSPEIRLRSIAKTIHSEQNHVDRNFGRTIHSILAIPRISLLSSKLVQMIAGDGDRNSFVSSTDNARVVVGVLGQLRRIAPLCDEVSGVFADLGKAMVNAHVQRISDWQTVQLESSVGTDDAVSLQQSGELFNLFVGAKRAGECLHRLRDLTGFSIDEVHSSERRKVVKDSVSLGLYFALATEAVETLGFAVDSLDEIAVLSRQMRMSLDGVLDTDTARPIKSIWQKFDEAQANMQAAFPAILEGGAFMKKGGAFVSKDVNEGRVFWGFGRLLEVEKTSTVVRALRQYIVRRCQSDPIFGSSSVAVKKMDAKSLLEVISDDGKWESDFERRFFIAIDRTRDGVVSVAQFRRWIFKHGGLFAAVEATIELANVENSSQMTDDIPPPTEMLKELEEWLEPVSFADELQQYLLRSELNESKEDSIRWVTDQIDKANNTSSRSEGAATRVLWLSMPTCSGKSTLSALLSHYHGDYDHRGTMSVAGHAYVGLGGRLKDLSKLAQTWAFQLAARDEEFRKQLYHVMIRQKSSEDPDEHEISDKGWVTAFQTLITDPFMMLKQIQLDEKADIEDGKSTKACMFVLDGFEEGKLSNRHRSSFLSLLKAESKYLPTHIKFLVTSNRHPSQKLLIEASNLPTGFVFPLVWDQFQQELDMQRYCFKILQKKLDGWPTLEVKHQKEGPIAELVTRADGNWLWLTFAAKILAHINDRAIATEHVLQIPQDLDGLIWHSFATSIHSWKTSSANYRTTSGNSSFLDRSFQLVSEQRSTVENGSSLQSLDDLLGLIKMAASSENPDVHELTRLIARIPTSSQLQQLQSPPSTPPQIVSTAATPGSRRRSTASSSIHIKNMRTITPPSPIVEVDNVPISANSDIAVLNSLELVDLEITQQVLWTIDVLQEPVPIKLLATLTRLTEDDVRKAIWCLNSTSFTVVDADTGTVKIAHSEFSMFMRDKERSGAYLPSSLHPTLISREQITFSLFEDQQRQHLVLAERCLEILKSKLFASRAEVSVSDT